MEGKTGFNAFLPSHCIEFLFDEKGDPPFSGIAVDGAVYDLMGVS